MENCKVEGCEKLEKTKGYCTAHYLKMRKYGDPLFFIRQRNVVKEILPKVKKSPKRSDLRYDCYRSMIYRCNKLNKKYDYYKSRGITVCEEWKDKEKGFDNFCKDMGERPSLKYSIDRINNDLGYYKENCRWATIHEQQANRRNINEFVGVHSTKRGKYVAELTVNRVIYQKSFQTIEEAVLYRKELEFKYL